MKSYTIGPETYRLKHRAFMIDDAEAFYALNSNPDVMRFTAEPMIPSLEDAREAIRNYADFEVVGYGRWACIVKETDTIIGFCGLKYLADLDAVDVGYRLHPQYWGQGFATEACIASLQFGFTTLKLKEIIGLVLPANAASIRVLEKAGMNFEQEFTYDGLQVLKYIALAKPVV